MSEVSQESNNKNDTYLDQDSKLIDRYNYIVKESIPLVDRWNPPQQILPILKRLKDLEILVVTDPPKWDLVSLSNERLGSAVVVPGQKTIIWINLEKHKFGKTEVNNLELIDTIIHEAMHATGDILKRFVVQPENTGTTEYVCEEICALAGASAVHGSLRNAQYSRSNKKSAQFEADKLTDITLRRKAIQNGNAAALFILNAP